MEKRVRDNYHKLTKTLIDKKLTISTMESATSGQIASLITDTEGSSAVIKGAYITYSNEAKIKQGVPSELIDKYSVYSKEVSAKMAEICKKSYNADIGIGVTGTMGNIDPANESASEIGNVYFSISIGDYTYSYHETIKPMDTRLSYKLKVADLVYEELIKLI